MGIEGGEKADKEVDQEALRTERATYRVAAMARRDRDAIGTGPGAPKRPTSDLFRKEFSLALGPTKTNLHGQKLGGGEAAGKKNANYNFHGDFPRGRKNAQMEISARRKKRHQNCLTPE